MLRTYGLTRDQYEAMLDAQGGVCALCKRPARKIGGFILDVDHDHVTGKVRSLLCRLCNIGIGHFHEDPTLLRAAAEYLEKYDDRRKLCP